MSFILHKKLLSYVLTLGPPPDYKLVGAMREKQFLPKSWLILLGISLYKILHDKSLLRN